MDHPYRICLGESAATSPLRDALGRQVPLVRGQGGCACTLHLRGRRGARGPTRSGTVPLATGPYLTPCVRQPGRAFCQNGARPTNGFPRGTSNRRHRAFLPCPSVLSLQHASPPENPP